MNHDAPIEAPFWLLPVVHVLDQWMGRGVSPREAVAAQFERGAPAEDRVAVSRIAYAAIRKDRQLAFALGDAVDDLDRNGRAAAIALAEGVSCGDLSPDDARELFLRWSPVDLAFDDVLRVESAARRIPDATQRFAVLHSLPDWVAALLIDEFGDEATAFASALAQEPPRAIRVNTLKAKDRGELAMRLADVGISTTFGRYAKDALLVTDQSSLFETEAYRLGMFEQQDEGSQLVALVTAPPPRGRVFDACAGAGGKSLALAALLDNKGRVLAADVHKGRMDGLAQRAARAGAFNLECAIVPEDDWPQHIAAFAASCDRILLDVPCSGIGSWRRRPEARWMLEPKDLDSLLRTQAMLLDRAAHALKPGSRIVYATCTVLRRENEAQVEAALARHPSLELVRIAEILGKAVAQPISDPTGTFLSLRPDRHGADGFFAAVLRKKR
jgi:16S rRNA (cytosine967-C5)-methyltransferase